MTSTAAAPALPDDSGFSLVEVIVSMLLLAVSAVAFLPLALRATTTAATGTTVVTATRLVSEQMELVRATPATCPVDHDGAVVETLTDPRGVLLQMRTDVDGVCAAGPVTFRVAVTRSTAPTDAVATATTIVMVDAP